MTEIHKFLGTYWKLLSRYFFLHIFITPMYVMLSPWSGNIKSTFRLFFHKDTVLLQGQQQSVAHKTEI